MNNAGQIRGPLGAVWDVLGRLAAPIDLAYWYAVMSNVPLAEDEADVPRAPRRRFPSGAAGVLALVGHVVAALFYVVLPGLEVTFPTLYLFWAAWVAVLVLTLYWLRGHPWRSVALVLIGVVAVNAIRVFGERQLGWRG